MIFDEIVIENFGVYAGRQVATLTPQKGKPIILFGGLNGGGKTTLLDALQLVLYGKRARTSNRGRRTYDSYLHECIHRGADQSVGSNLELRFHRFVEGRQQSFAVRRSWRTVGDDVRESFEVALDGVLDASLTENWDEFIEAYLPSDISHLFFFDGEQIRELADKQKASEILRSAVSTLFGVELIDRLEADLKVFERRKRAEVLDGESKAEFERLQAELRRLDEEQESLAGKAGSLRVECDKLTTQVLAAERNFQREGGDIFVRRGALEERFNALKKEEARIDEELRELAASALPLALVEPLLERALEQSLRDQKTREAKMLKEVLAQRDTQVLAQLERRPECAGGLEILRAALAEDRLQRSKLADSAEMFDASPDFASRLVNTLGHELPALKKRLHGLLEEAKAASGQLELVETDLAKVPSSEQIAGLQALLDEARRVRANKQAELDATAARIAEQRGLRSDLEKKLERAARLQVEEGVAQGDRGRVLLHSEKSRSTLNALRQKLTKQRCEDLEGLILSSFQNLLRKENLVSRLCINSGTFEITLFDQAGANLPFDRLSAGERQLLATAILWGLARASGRVLPMLIDTPLGRLDSSHRMNLVDYYFPVAAPQILLLSTDEELVDKSYEKLSDYVSHEYLLRQRGSGGTEIERGYLQ